VASGSRIIWSDNVYRIFGFEPGEVHPSLELILERTVPADRDRLAEYFWNVVAGGDPISLEYRITRADGMRRHLRSTLAVIEPRADQALRQVGVVQDVTDSRRAEREIAAHVAVDEALVEWDALESGGYRLLAQLGTALDCIEGVFWTPLGDVLVPRVRWNADDGDPRVSAEKHEARRVSRGNGLAARVREAGKPLSWTLGDAGPPSARSAAPPLAGAVAVPAIYGDEVLAVVELNSDLEIRPSERLLRSLHGIAHELGHFLARRRAELAVALLSAREVEVLQHGAAGLTARMTAERLMVSPGTIRTHLENIYQKLQVSDKASAVATALRLGIID
jgi:PAS domain S-box-containing protein